MALYRSGEHDFNNLEYTLHKSFDVDIEISGTVVVKNFLDDTPILTVAHVNLSFGKGLTL